MESSAIDPRRPSEKISLTVRGLNCTNCALSLEKHLERIGADGATVDFASGATNFSLQKADLLPDIVRSIERLGYNVSGAESSAPTTPWWATLEAKAVVCAVLTLPLILHMFFAHSIFHDPYVQLALATPVFLIGLRHFGASAVRSLRGGVANMDVLITAGFVSGYIASVSSLALGLGSEYLFFEAVASIITFVMIGHLVEDRAVRRTTSAIEDLSKLQARHAKKIFVEDGQETIRSVEVSDLRSGDIVQVNTGDKFPADGVVVSGSGSVDESMLTGESRPVDREAGEKVVGGTILIAGSVTAKITATGADTVLASIVAMVRDAQQRRPQIQRVGDKISAIFVPVVMLFSLLFLVGGITLFQMPIHVAIIRALAIVVVACPCAMGLATPTAVMVALGRAAKIGVLVRGGDTLERMADIRRIAFDKTGTLTTGELTVGKPVPLDGAEYDEAASMVLALQRPSSHPIARAVSRELESLGVKQAALTSFEELKGQGVEGRTADGTTYSLGGRAMAKRLGTTIEHDLVLFRESKPIAALSLTDKLRPEAKSAVGLLASMGFSSSLISGDRREVCESIAAEVGITDVYSEQLPEQKLEILRTLQKESSVAYVGDGINDAPTLSEASVGVSLSSASDVAVQSAQVVLAGGNLSALPTSFALAKATVRTIKQNLFWAFLYNVTAIPLAAFGYISPLWGAILMSFSDVLIVGNSLRLRYRKL